MNSLLVIATLLAGPARADEIFTFECDAFSVDAAGNVSKLMFNHSGATLDGQAWIAVGDVGGHMHQDVANSTNKYKTKGKNAKTLVAIVKSVTRKDKYDGYPKNDAGHIMSDVYEARIAIKVAGGEETKYFGVCGQRYSGD